MNAEGLLPGLPDFPAADGAVETPALLSGRGLSLRRATQADLAWLCRLYATTRAEEMAGVPWPESMKQAFLADQFGLQHRHYVAHFGDGDFLILAGERGPIGRYYVQRSTPDHLLVDISLWPDVRQQGVGQILIAASQRQAQRAGCGMRLHVAQHNVAARRLYERLGFAVTGTQGSHYHMHWAPGDATA